MSPLGLNEELERLELRGTEVVEIFRYVAGGGPIHPLSVITSEGAAWCGA